jgi:hypothetical protein
MALALRVRVLVLAATAAISVILLSGAARAADTVVQVPVDGLIDGRTVSTFTGGAVVPWGAGQGVDGDGNADGYVTTAVEAELVKQGKTVGGVAGKALPDDGLFSMDARHPAIQLHFSNAADKASPQTHQLYIAKGMQSFQLPVPAATYSKMFLLITASEGPAALTLTLNYAGGAQPVVTKLMLPDYGVGGAPQNDAVFFNLIAGMRKWSASNQEGDGPSHTITGIELTPAATNKLTGIGVEKTNGSHVVFWGATGIATSAVDIGGGGGSGGAAGAGGAAGSAGAAAGAAAGGAATAGAATGGAAGTGGTASAGGTSALAGAAGSANAGQAGSMATAGGSSAGSTPSATSSDSGGCVFSHLPTQTAAGWLSLAIAFGLVLRRRRRAA